MVQSSITPTHLPKSYAAAKSVFQSSTVWGAILTAIAAVSPIVAQQVDDYQTVGKIDPHGVSDIVIILAGTAATIMGRLNATTTVYTPKGVPGPDKPEGL